MKSLVFLPFFFAFAVSAISPSKDNNVASQHIKSEYIRRFERPYTSIIELRKKGIFARHCSLAQLSAEWFLIPAECMKIAGTDSMKIIELDYDNKVHGTTMIWLAEKIHPEYNEKTKENNIALIKCYAHEQPTSTKDLPRLPSKNHDLLNAPAAVYGWVNWPRTESLTMTTIETKVINPLWCKLVYPSRFKEDKHLCVSGFGDKGLSQDDTGAPLVITNSDKVKELVGVATHIRPFTTALPVPMVFTKLEPYMEWIHKETEGELKK